MARSSNSSGAVTMSGSDVATWLRERIRKGRLVPGQRLVEIDIMAETGASRLKVREAFQRLEAEGLVKIEEYRGASVRRASTEEIRQIYRIREGLESISAGDFTRRATDEDRARISQLQVEFNRCIEERTTERFAKLNHDFHSFIIAGSGNSIARDLLSRLTVPINRLLFESFYDEKWMAKANTDHQAITAAILAQDPEAAEAAMRHHIAEGFRTLSAITTEFEG
jgi:DNA-binding GntR family transcriptional regulator